MGGVTHPGCAQRALIVLVSVPGWVQWGWGAYLGSPSGVAFRTLHPFDLSRRGRLVAFWGAVARRGGIAPAFVVLDSWRRVLAGFDSGVVVVDGGRSLAFVSAGDVVGVPCPRAA